MGEQERSLGKHWEPSRSAAGAEPGARRVERRDDTHPNKQPEKQWETQGNTQENTEGITEGTAVTVTPCQSKLTQCRVLDSVFGHFGKLEFPLK